jgi:hypothetical protein
MAKKKTRGKSVRKKASASARAKAKSSAKTKASAGDPAAAKAGRGTAPWVARHAAKQAAEARRRNDEPIPPGSARATLRVPDQADRIKAEISELHALVREIRGLKKQLDSKFLDVGTILGQIRDRELFRAKGYSSFETFVERELDLGKAVCLNLEKIPRLFQLDAARELGFAALSKAVAALEEHAEPTAPPKPLRPPTRSRR